MLKEILESEKYQFLNSLKRASFDDFKEDMKNSSKIIYSGNINTDVNFVWDAEVKKYQSKKSNIEVIEDSYSSIRIKLIENGKTDTIYKKDVSVYKKETDNGTFYFLKSGTMVREFFIVKK